MYVIVEHDVSDPAQFWTKAQQSLPSLPSNVKLHHCFPTPDGSRAVCVWEADSVGTVEEIFEQNAMNQSSSNTFYGVENKEGVALPSLV